MRTPVILALTPEEILTAFVKVTVVGTNQMSEWRPFQKAGAGSRKDIPPSLGRGYSFREEPWGTPTLLDMWNDQIASVVIPQACAM